MMEKLYYIQEEWDGLLQYWNRIGNIFHKNGKPRTTKSGAHKFTMEEFKKNKRDFPSLKLKAVKV